MWKRFGVFTVIALGVAAAALITTALSEAQDGNQDGRVFLAELSGDNEVPPVETDTGGLARVTFTEDFSEASFMLVVDDGVDVFMAHIHCGPEGENGPIAVWLAGQHPAIEDQTVGWDVDGIWVGDASVSDDNVIPTDCGDNLGDLADEIADGNMYVNVHSVEFPGGVARGQLR